MLYINVSDVKVNRVYMNFGTKDILNPLGNLFENVYASVRNRRKGFQREKLNLHLF